MSNKLPGSAWRIALALVLAFSMAGISVQQARALTYTVSNLNDSGAGSLRQAITSANSHAGADIITFTASGTITLASLLPAISDDLTIDGTGQNVVVDGADRYRVFYINPGNTVTLDHLKITNTRADGPPSGGIYGGGIYSEGVLTVTNGSFTSNTAVYGGAIASFGGTLTVTDCTFSDNSSDYGGAIVSADSVNVKNSTFSGNSSDYGGAIDNYGGTLDVANSTFSANTATLYGGGIFTTNAGVAYVTNSTFSGNSADTDGGGIFIYNDSSLNMKNTIVANSTSGGDCDDLGIFAGDLGNLIESNNGCGTPVSSADPMLASLANNGGATRTFGLKIGSPAIDAGDDGTCAAAPVNNLDQRGQSRPYGSHCDIGSVEVRNTSATLTTRSVGTYDGWILESGENTNLGGTLDSAGTTFYLGDGVGDKQYRAILSFNTTGLPDNAIITKVTLKIKKQGVVGTNPFNILGGLKVDIRKPYFGTGAGLVAGDFQAAAGRTNAATFSSAPVSNWYSAVMNSLGYPYINLTGTTQFRLRFLTGDNDDGAADYMKFFSGNYATASARPTLVIGYYVP